MDVKQLCMDNGITNNYQEIEQFETCQSGVNQDGLPPPPTPNKSKLFENGNIFKQLMKSDNNNNLPSITENGKESPQTVQENVIQPSQNISDQFDLLIQKAEMAIDSLDQIQIKQTAPKHLTNERKSLTDQLKEIINADGGEEFASNSICSVDSAVSESASDTLMLAAIKDDNHQINTNNNKDIDDGRSSTASSSILDNRTSLSSDANTSNNPDDCLSVLSGVTSDLDNVSASPVLNQNNQQKFRTFDELSSCSSTNNTGSSSGQFVDTDQSLPPPPPPNTSDLTNTYGANSQFHSVPQKLFTQMNITPNSMISGQLYGTTALPMTVPAIHQQQQQQQQQYQQTSMVQANIANITNSKFITKQIEAHQNNRQMFQNGTDALNTESWDTVQENNFELSDFAKRYCNSHPREAYAGTVSGASGNTVRTLTRKKKSGGDTSENFLTPNEMMLWTSAAVIPTSHVHLHDPQNVVLSCAIFKELCKYLSGEKKPEVEVRFIQTVIGHGIERDELRDEIFVQLVRQSNDNPNKEQVVRCWALLALATAAFMPGKNFSKYLLTYLRRHLRSHTSIACYAQFCLDNLHTGRLHARRYPPSVAEVKAVTALRSLVCRFHLLDGRTKAMDLHPADTAADAVVALATKLNLRNVDGWAIFEVTPEGERVLRGHDYVADVLTVWEMRAKSENKNSTQTSTISTSSSVDSINNMCMFMFKKRLFRTTGEIPRDPVEVGLLYSQAVHSVVRLDEFPVSERIALQLAGLQAQVSLGDFIPGRIRSYEDVENYISARVRRAAGHSSMEWAVKIADAHRLYGAGKALLVAKVWYLSLVMQYPLYGAALFPAQYKGFLAVFGNNPLLLGVHAAAILVVAASDKRVLATYKYSDIETLTIYPAESLLTIKLFKESPEDSHKCLTFETSQKEEIASLVAAYSPTHATGFGFNTSGITDILSTPVARGPRRLLKMTLEDRLRLHTEVINCRRALVVANIMRKPAAENTGKWKTTLRRLSRNKTKTNSSNCNQINIDDDYTNDEVLRNYTRQFWAYIKEPLTSSLLVISDPDLEGSAVTMFEQILSYSGLRSVSIASNGNNSTTDSSNSDEEWCIRSTVTEQNQVRAAQAILDKCLGGDADIVRNEFFLQLIRQTTDHPEPNSRVNIRHWQLLALACSLTQPSDRRVLAYLHSHLRRCALDQVTREGQYAQFALRNLQGTLETRGRRLAPSRPEIAATIQCRRVYARVHFLDGHFQAVEFDACAVIAEVLEQIQLKIELRPHAPGYALYQVLGTTGGEQALQPEDKVGDAIAFWERWHDEHSNRLYGNATGGQAEPVHYFIFKVCFPFLLISFYNLKSNLTETFTN